ncbi:MAG: chemotaxis protein CheD [Candidatus Hydrogenedentes bacterium]|nr:chemotaxis protein CheD [Candidatus Hydrogenedentota bacterium]
MRLTRRKPYHVEPGFVFFSRKAMTLQAVVGSCVAVCLWDKSDKCGGMHHFIKPKTRAREDATPVYGNVGIAALLKMMEEAGCKRTNLIAHVLGGGAPEGEAAPTLGDQNIAAAREALRRKRIVVIAEDSGGPIGRKIAFDTSTGELAVLKTMNVRAGDWYA